ncbi:hypothetical protein ScFU97_15960 [Streptococcus canis]|nr:hypothetical protein ScFU97_15960 [Streptococcus canis]
MGDTIRIKDKSKLLGLIVILAKRIKRAIDPKVKVGETYQYQIFPTINVMV